MHKNIIIVGGGIAGISCASQLALNNLIPLIIEKNSIGGMIKYAHRVMNIPFIENSTQGKDIIKHLQNTVSTFKIPVEYETVVDVSSNDGLLLLKSNSGSKYSCNQLVIATGTEPVNPFNLNMIPRDKWSFYPVAPQSNADSVVILGGGDIAFDYALSMKKYTDNIQIICRSDLRANKYLETMVSRRNITVCENQEILSITENGQIHIATSDYYINADHIIIACGRKTVLPQIPHDMEHYENIHMALSSNYSRNMMINAAARGMKCALDIVQRGLL